MTDLSAQKRLAAEELDVGENRVWFDPEAQDELADAITREDIRDLVADGTIRAEDTQGNSRGRARTRQEKKDYGHGTGAGTRKGKAGARRADKDEWISRIRAQRSRLKELRDEEEVLDSTQYRELYNKASGGEFDSVARLEAFARNNYDVEIGGDD